MPWNRVDRRVLARYRGRGDASAIEIARWVAENSPGATSRRAQWLARCYDRVLELAGLGAELGDSHEERVKRLEPPWVPSPEVLLTAMRHLEKVGEVVPECVDVREFHEKHRRAARRKREAETAAPRATDGQPTAA